MVENSQQEEQKRRRAAVLIGDYLQEKEELHEGPRFHVPPFIERRIEGTRTIYYAPVEDAPARPLEAPPAARPLAAQLGITGAAPQATGQRATGGRPGPEDAGTSLPSRAPPEHGEEERGPPGGRKGEEDRGPSQTEGSRGAPKAFEIPRPVSFRKPFVRPDTFGTRRTDLPPMIKRPSAKELIAKLRVVKEGVETRENIVQRMAEEAEAATAQPSAGPAGKTGDSGEAPAEEKEVGEAIAALEGGGTSTQKNAVAPGEAPAAASLAVPPPYAGAQEELAQKTEGGKLCPSCGSPISEKNRLLICTDCGRAQCDSCGRYEKSHMKADVYYEYQFDFPLCLTCYEKAFTIQRMLGRSSVCYGNGNYSYALWYAKTALQQDPESKYAPRAREIIEQINKAQKAASERDREWRFARKQFATRPPEDPRWR